MSTPTATQQIKELIGQIEQRDSLNCAQAFLAITERLRNLYDQRIKVYIPTATSQVQLKIKEQKEAIEALQEELQNLKELNNDLEQEIDAKSELEKKEQIIKATHTQLQQRHGEIEELHRIKLELEKPENDFEALERKKEELLIGYKEVIKRQTETLNRVNALLERSNNAIDKELRSVIGTVRDNIQKLQNGDAKLLLELSTEPLQSGAEGLDKKLDELIASYNKYVVKIRAINEEIEKVNVEQEAMVKSYKDRYETNKEIFGKLEEPVAVQQYIEKSMKGMDDLLITFEQRISELQRLRSKMTIPEVYERKSERINS